MAPQENIPLAANVLSTIGTVFWCVQLIPQIYHNWRNKKTDGLPGAMMFLWALCAVPFGVYAVVQNFAIPIQIQPQCFGFFALVSWGQILYYNNGWPALRTIVVTSVLIAFLGGIEVMLIYTLRIPYNNGVGWPIILIGVIAAIFLTLGLIPPYYEIWKRSGRVIGINWVFLSIDWLGGLFSLLAVVTQETFDVLGGILYILVIVLEGVVFASHMIWRLRTRRLRQLGKEKGIDFDDMPEAKKYQHHKPPKRDLHIESDESQGAATKSELETHSSSSRTISNPVNDPC